MAFLHTKLLFAKVQSHLVQAASLFPGKLVFVPKPFLWLFTWPFYIKREGAINIYSTYCCVHVLHMTTTVIYNTFPFSTMANE